MEDLIEERVKAALRLGTQAIQEVQIQAAEDQRQAVEAEVRKGHAQMQQMREEKVKAVAFAVAAERAQIMEEQARREKEIVDRLVAVAEAEQAAATQTAIDQTEARCAEALELAKKAARAEERERMERAQHARESAVVDRLAQLAEEEQVTMVQQVRTRRGRSEHWACVALLVVLQPLSLPSQEGGPRQVHGGSVVICFEV